MGNLVCRKTTDIPDAEKNNDNIITSPHDTFHRNILRETNDDIFKKYRLIEVLGNGSMGFVAKAKIKPEKAGGKQFQKKRRRRLFRRRLSNDGLDRRTIPAEYAIKSIIMDRVSSLFLNELKNEIEIIRSMDHPNIVKAREVFYHKKQAYIVMELSDGGDLYGRLPYSESDAASIATKILSAVKYMHDHGIVHRDLKFENILFENRNPNAEIKVIDFGLSKKFLEGELGTMTEGVGTMYTMAPQVLQGIYTSQADLWSTGVITYMLLVSRRPFYNKTREVMIDRIMRATYNFEAEYWDPITNEAKNFVSKLLVINPNIRYDAKKALEHKWLSNEFKIPEYKPNKSISEAVGDSLLLYRNTGTLKKLALNVVANLSSADEIRELRKCFDQYDTSNDGIISYEEFKHGLERAKSCNKSIRAIFDSVDVNANSMIDYTEFLAAALEAQGHIEEERIAEAFDRLDSDHSGYISKANLRDFLGKTADSSQIEAIIMEGDTDHDGKISYKEFLQLFRNNTRKLVRELSYLPSKSDSNLLGLDAYIPGGRQDTVRMDSVHEEVEIV